MNRLAYEYIFHKPIMNFRGLTNLIYLKDYEAYLSRVVRTSNVEKYVWVQIESTRSAWTQSCGNSWGGDVSGILLLHLLDPDHLVHLHPLPLRLFQSDHYPKPSC